jgi:molecular chaperone DnaK (HSP70)
VLVFGKMIGLKLLPMIMVIVQHRHMSLSLEILIGEAAKNQAVMNPQFLV